MGNIHLLILSIGAVVFFTLLLVTGNTMASAVRERIPELAVLKTVGFSDATVLALVLARVGAARRGRRRARARPRQALHPRRRPDRRHAAGVLPRRSADRARPRAGGGGRPAGRRDPGPRSRCGCASSTRCGGCERGDPAHLQPAQRPRSAGPPPSWRCSASPAPSACSSPCSRMARGFQATLVASGSEGNAIVLRAGADSEMDSAITLDEVRVIDDAPGVERDAGGAAGVAGGGGDRRLPARIDRHRRQRPGARRVAVGARRAPTVRVAEGRFFRPGWPSWWSAATPPPSTAASSSATRSTSAAGLEGGRHLRRRRQRLRLRALVRRDGAQPDLRAPREHLPVGDGQTRLERPLRRVQGRADLGPAADRAGRARDRVLREAVARADDPDPGARLPGRGRDGGRRRVRRPQHDVLGGRRAVARDRHPARPRLQRRQRRGRRSSSSRC